MVSPRFHRWDHKAAQLLRRKLRTCLRAWRCYAQRQFRPSKGRGSGDRYHRVVDTIVYWRGVLARRRFIGLSQVWRQEAFMKAKMNSVQLRVARPTPAYWRVTIDNPP